MPLPPLTKRQRQILDYYLEYRREHRISPTLDEVAQHFGVNRVTIFGHVAELERKGVLTRSGRNISRGLSPAPEETEGATTTPEIAHLNIIGTIAAGAPIEALESPQPVDWASVFPPDRELYLLRVRGDSMIDDHIQDGDLVVVERRHNARDGEIVVAVLADEEATLKRLYRDGQRYRLEPANSRLEPRTVDELEIRGVVIGILRTLRD
jgi:repressor LexA